LLKKWTASGGSACPPGKHNSVAAPAHMRGTRGLAKRVPHSSGRPSLEDDLERAHSSASLAPLGAANLGVGVDVDGEQGTLSAGERAEHIKVGWGCTPGIAPSENPLTGPNETGYARASSGLSPSSPRSAHTNHSGKKVIQLLSTVRLRCSTEGGRGGGSRRWKGAPPPGVV
jgi:hypothetical protein